VCNTPGYADRTVAEHALALLLASTRRLPRLDREVRSGGWGRIQGIELTGKRLGVIGFGGIGRRMAELGRGIGMDVVAWTRHPERYPEAGVPLVPLETLLETSQAVSIHVALGPDTEGLIDAAALARLPPGAILVNTARGAVVDEPALVAALASGRLGGAGLDVFATEPLPPDHPLATLDRVVLSPHAAYATPEASAEIMELAVGNIERYVAGDPRHVVAAPAR
jgi:D-3-phosphoglycerate dehydrogenase